MFIKFIELIVSMYKIQTACIIATLSNMVAMKTLLPLTNDITFGTQHDKAKIALQNLKFCGYNWYSYAGINSGTNEYTIPAGNLE